MAIERIATDTVATLTGGRHRQGRGQTAFCVGCGALFGLRCWQPSFQNLPSGSGGPCAHSSRYEVAGVVRIHSDSMGAIGLTVTSVAEMAPALEEAKRLNADGQTVLIDVHSNMEPKKSRY